MEDKIRMHIFEKFSLESPSVCLDEKTFRSKRLIQLLVYIVINKDRTLSQQELVDAFWEDSSRNPSGALKNLVYRLRGALRVFGDREYICTLQGAYRWNPEIEVETDLEVFEKLAADIRDEENEEKKEALCQKAVLKYPGAVSPKLAGIPWMVLKITWYESVYMDIVKILCAIWEKQSRWREIEELCRKALEADVMEEDIQCWMIKSLYRQEKYDQAISHYEAVSRMFYDSLGIRTTKKMRAVFQEIMQESDGHLTDIASLMQEASEPVRPRGAFLCDYQIFQLIFQVEARRLGRLGISGLVLILTVNRSRKVARSQYSDAGLLYGVEFLGKLLEDTLRIGDVVSRYSFTQYIVLLSACTYERGELIADRILNRWKKGIGKRQIEITYEIGEVAPID